MRECVCGDEREREVHCKVEKSDCVLLTFECNILQKFIKVFFVGGRICGRPVDADLNEC